MSDPKGSCSCSPASEPPQDPRAPAGQGAARARRNNGLLLAACAVGLAWLGPLWQVAPILVALGVVLLLAMAAASLYGEDAGGAPPRRSALALVTLSALLVGVPWAWGFICWWVSCLALRRSGWCLAWWVDNLTIHSSSGPKP